MYFPDAGITKLELVDYFLAVADGALLGVRDRPMALKRFVDGITGEAFFQKRAPKSVPEYVSTVELAFPSGRTADEVVVSNRAALAWVANLGCVDLNPHPVRADDLDHPDELRADLDPGPGVPWADVRRRGAGRRATCWPITAWSAGRRPPARAASISTRASSDAGASPRSVARRWPWPARSSDARPTSPPASGGRRSATASSSTTTRTPRTARWRPPIRCGRCRPPPSPRRCTWDEVPDAELGDFTLRTMPDRYAKLGDVGAGIDAAVGSLEALLELSARDEATGQGDAPWPPNYAKQPGEPPRVQPSKRRMPLA